jgi:xylulokinase
MVTSPYLVGIDIGTSSAKAVVVDRAGKLLSWAGREYSIHSLYTGWAEENPADWLAAAAACCSEAVRQAGIDPRNVGGVGLTGQMHSLVCVDARSEPLRPAILWADQRSSAQVRALVDQIGRAQLAEWTGNPLAAGFMLASWAWLKENEPRTARDTHLLMLAKDYVRLRLTGRAGSEPSDASSTLLFDPHMQRWSAPLLEMIGLTEEHLPAIQPSGGLAGGLLREMAAACGLVSGTPIAMGASDVSAQALAQGIIEPGTVSCTIGTGGQLFAPLSVPRHDPELRLHLFCHCLPETWHQEAAILAAGLALRWLRDQVFRGQEYGALADTAQTVEAGSDGLFFLPFLVGERTPYMEPGLRAGFLGLGLRHNQAHMTRAVMEGVVFALRQGLELMQSLGTPSNRLVASGGSTRHPLWLQLQADIFNRPIFISTADEATGRGAALLAGIASGVYADARDAIRQAGSEPIQAALPDPERTRHYDAAYQEYTHWADLLAESYRSHYM